MTRLTFISPRIVLLFLFCLLFSMGIKAQDTLRVHFFYGSRPGKLFKLQESKRFGGIHGGHVSLETEDGVYGFGPKGKFHIVARRKKHKRHSYFQYQTMEEFCRDSSGNQYLTIFIPVIKEQMECVDSLHSCYRQDVPYDYAFIGMRCTAASSDILSQIGLLKPRRKKGQIRYFYPRKLRNKLTQMAIENNWPMVYREGNPRRKWEPDLKRTWIPIRDHASFQSPSR